MIKIKIEEDKNNKPLLKLDIKEEDKIKYKFLKRPLMEAKLVKGEYNYIVPIKYLVPIINNLKKEDKKINEDSIDYLEFSDDFEENYFVSTKATAKYMKLWRQENCPNIFKIHINKETLLAEKEVAFKKIIVLDNKF